MRRTNGFTLVSIVAILVALAFVGIRYNDRSAANPDAKYYALMERDLAADYPPSPNEVVKLYNEAKLFLYSAAVSDIGQYSDVIAVQRELFSPELKDESPLDELIAHYEMTADSLLSAGSKLIGAEDEMVIFGNNVNYATVQVTEYWDADKRLYFRYNLHKSANNQWQITGIDILEMVDIKTER